MCLKCWSDEVSDELQTRNDDFLILKQKIDMGTIWCHLWLCTSKMFCSICVMLIRIKGNVQCLLENTNKKKNWRCACVSNVSLVLVSLFHRDIYALSWQIWNECYLVDALWILHTWTLKGLDELSWEDGWLWDILQFYENADCVAVSFPLN